MKPYYQKHNLTLYLGDCVEVMREMPDTSIDAIITDPPYGINATHAGGRGMNGWTKYNTSAWDKERPSKEVFEELLRIGRKVLIWGGNYFTDYLPPSMQWLVWDKGQRNFSLADCELAWSSGRHAARVFTYPRALANREHKYHPTQKPVALMKWCMDMLNIPEGATILDPFTGSGTTAIACIKTNRQFIGIEISEEYCELSAKRIEAAFAQPMLALEVA